MDYKDSDGNWLICCIKGCEEKPIHLGLCVNHHRLNVKYGSPVAHKIAPWRWLRLSYAERFWLNVRKSEGCWNWQGSRDKDGYGVFRGEQNGILYKKAHRFSYALNKGDVPALMQIMHSCDNPSCVNPEHLLLGTGAENQADKWAKGRGNVPFGQEHRWSVLTEEQAKAILDDPRPYAVISSEYNVAPSTIGSLKQRVSWPHLGNAKGVKAKRVSPRRGVSASITPEIVREIRTSATRGIELAAKFGVTEQTISDIRRRRSWKHIE